MRCIILILVLILTGFESIFAQSKQDSAKLKKFDYYCYSHLDSILLPFDFRGPDTFPFEEGSIISFTTHDSCIVSILCGSDAILNLDSTYLRIETIKSNKSGSKLYYSSVKNRYARQDCIRNILIMYENATEQRKLKLDKIFDLLKLE